MMIKCRIITDIMRVQVLVAKKRRWDIEVYATHILGPLEAASVQPVWFLYGLKRYTLTMINYSEKKKLPDCWPKKHEMEKQKTNKHTMFTNKTK